jgi:hypothetical protein
MTLTKALLIVFPLVQAILARTLQAARELFAKLLDKGACEIIDHGWA